jgi:hypothetical protein
VIPSARDVVGNKVSPKAVIAPLAPKIIMPITPTKTSLLFHFSRWLLRGSPKDAQHAVKVMLPSSKKVFTRCIIIENARTIESLSATRPKSTSPAPINASVTVNAAEREAHNLPWLLLPKTFQLQITRTSTKGNVKPLVNR